MDSESTRCEVSEVDAIDITDPKKRQTGVAEEIVYAKKLITAAQSDRKVIMARLDQLIALMHDAHAL